MDQYPSEEILRGFRWRDGEVYYRGLDLNTFGIYRKFFHCSQPVEHIAAENRISVEEVEAIIRFHMWRGACALPGSAASDTTKEAFDHVLEQLRLHRCEFSYLYSRQHPQQHLYHARKRLPGCGLPGQQHQLRPSVYRHFERIVPIRESTHARDSTKRSLPLVQRSGDEVERAG